MQISLSANAAPDLLMFFCGKERVENSACNAVDSCLCKHNPRCPNPQGHIILPGYHRADEFLVGNWQTENEDLWRLVWEKNCQTLLLIGSDYIAQKFWTLENGSVGEMFLERRDGHVILQNERTSYALEYYASIRQVWKWTRGASSNGSKASVYSTTIVRCCLSTQKTRHFR
ncbi:hypothetical protein L596_006322 [Steinernema carpocapsae]|uniref:Uncharacterized protein n=1 Tax=Steinernema carpocapsae TaxID=34508 RepID=A0A4U8V3Q4_STECR|nr:hypothetical protein L596_006322 [Steinernema carpocapsae]